MIRDRKHGEVRERERVVTNGHSHTHFKNRIESQRNKIITYLSRILPNNANPGCNSLIGFLDSTVVLTMAMYLPAEDTLCA